MSVLTVRRVLAVLGAAALIVGAVFLRNYLDDRDGGSTTTTEQPTTGRATVICSTEFKSVCDQLDDSKFTVTIEPAGDTLDALVKSQANPPDAWITLDPFPGMIDEVRTRVPLPALSPEATVVATAVPQLAVAAGRAGSFDLGCSGKSAWSCTGSAAGGQWTALDPAAANGAVLAGISDPSSEAIGLVSFANGVAGYFGTPQLDTSSWSDPKFGGWLRNLTARVAVAAPGTTPLDTLLVRSTQVNVAATTSVQTGAAPAASTDKFVVKTVDPVVGINAVVATFTERGKNVVDPITSLLVQGGWSRASDPNPSLPAGTFVALRKLWEDSN